MLDAPHKLLIVWNVTLAFNKQHQRFSFIYLSTSKLRGSVMHTAQLFRAVCFWKDAIPNAVKYWISLTSVKALIFLSRLNNFSNNFFFCFSGLLEMISHAHLPSTTMSSSMPSFSCPQPMAVAALIPNRLSVWFHYGFERRNNDDRKNWLANFSFDYVQYSWKELNSEGSHSP